MKFRKLVWDLCFPLGFLLFAAIFAVGKPEILEKITPWLDTFLPVLFTLLVFIAWRFHRGRIVFAALTLGLAYALLATSLGDRFAPAQRGLLANALLLVIAFNFAALSLMQDRGVFGRWGISLAAVLMLESTLLFSTLPKSSAAFQAFLQAPIFDAAFRFVPAFIATAIGVGSTPNLVIVVLAAAMLTLAVAFFGRHTLVEAGLFWALIASVLGVRALTVGAHLQTYFALAGILLFFSVLEFSYALAYRDELTGLPARRALYETFKGLGSRYVIAMVDVDHFKKFNDRHGHDVGDQVLKLVASHLAKVGGGGRAFRYGGEEFSIVFPGRNFDEAVPHLEELREEIEQSRFTLRSPLRPKKKPPEKSKVTKRIENRARPRALGVTVSIGVAMADSATDDPEQILKEADRALYCAKQAGRNFVFVQKEMTKRRKKPTT